MATTMRVFSALAVLAVSGVGAYTWIRNGTSTDSLKLVDVVTARMDHKPTELSGGEMQRVAIARSLAMVPDIVLADEPTGNLDSSSGSDIMSLFEELWRQGNTVIVITHDLALARRASRVVEIRDGKMTSDRCPGD